MGLRYREPGDHHRQDRTVGHLVSSAPTGLPVAATAVHTLEEDMLRTIALSAADEDADPLRSFLTALPSAGKIFQTADGITPEAEITAAPALITDPLHRLLYLPPLNGSGNGLGDFKFAAADPSVLSAEAVVSVHVTPINDPPLARDDEIVVAPNQLNNPLSILRNDTDVDPPGTFTLLRSTPAQSGRVAQLPSGALNYLPPPGAPVSSKAHPSCLRTDKPCFSMAASSLR